MTKHRRAHRGQSTVELALTAPLLLLVLGGVVDVGRAIYYAEAVGGAARQVIQVAAYPDTTTGADLHPTSSAGLEACGPLNPGNLGQVSVTRSLPDPANDAVTVLVNRAAVESTTSSGDGIGAGSVLSNVLGPATTVTLTWNCDVSRHEPMSDSRATATDPGSSCPALPAAPSCSATIRVRVAYTYSPITPMYRSLLSSSVLSVGAGDIGYNQY